ncbi:type I-F CRISPR-associated helicase Cas3f [Marinomonas sp. IMCC 4694]|uniref:type I-F CRISPR-associated helicase Cas3f n=1 Tax=Marinomonas sp. IMCC 4694 TaxID=2605432 RepID=UPI0011E76072|nr:type I-F CRISPR-associated helicase Cas3f [Marinomonas sp. IMCC 4694]TYL47167.1 type I-F CRISPR-associated helicase Cas3 [Marinomonas sp. IMCC 4694]
MMVTFVSQCEKNSLKKTRRVLDAFANRIGDNTWQTLITEDGLLTVKKMLRKTASKNTAVSCHWIRSRSRSQFLWVVGNKTKFNEQGVVPVNSTRRDLLKSEMENDWHYLPLIKALASLAALLHDWGKATKLFQEKLSPNSKNKFKGDPIRHEWISLLLLRAFVQTTNSATDDEWLEKLYQGNIDEEQLKILVQNSALTPLANLPPIAQLIAWLIVSHHRLPSLFKDQSGIYKSEQAQSMNIMLRRITKEWGYENRQNEAEYQKRLKSCFSFPNGLLSNSNQWLKNVKRWSKHLIENKAYALKSIENGSYRLVLNHARLCLMLGDHYYSSQDAAKGWEDTTGLFANTDKNTQELKQKLDEHLVGVAQHSARIAHLLPAFENEPPFAEDIQTLRKASPKAFQWQDKAVNKITEYYRSIEPNKLKQGFFAVNMASTGCGKTFANAKVMRALSKDQKSLRFVLALGLRTLTLQTGREYRDRVGLDNSELAVLIGSRAVMELDQRNVALQIKESNESSGSESQESLLNEDVDFDCAIPEHALTTVLTKQRDKQFLYAPVLACTIDHLMSATETKRGGRYILPTLRLMSSDLVIDEIDDFTGDDLIAIGRLIHLAGMLGRKVMISSATIPPHMAEGYFKAYRDGWRLYCQTRDASPIIGCAWIDEFATEVQSNSAENLESAILSYRDNHAGFIQKRVEKLGKQPAKRKADIASCQSIIEQHKTQRQQDVDVVESKQGAYFSVIFQQACLKHEAHYFEDPVTQLRVSFGVVRMANISPCVALTKYLLTKALPSHIEVRVMAYHSQQVMLLRSEQERHLDEVLKRKEKSGELPNALKNSIIRQHVKRIQQNQPDVRNVLFILVATPVEEVGRDHDFDWAVIEPSSYRAIIQLAGRVRRHREDKVESTNIALMQYNWKGIRDTQREDSIVFNRPGFEENSLCLAHHNLDDLLDVEQIGKRLDAIPRIQLSDHLTAKYMRNVSETNRLSELEHIATWRWLANYKTTGSDAQIGPHTLQGWLNQHWFLTALPQILTPFRQSQASLNTYLVFSEPHQASFFCEKDDDGHVINREAILNIRRESLDDFAMAKLWLTRDFDQSCITLASEKDLSQKVVSIRYGELNFPHNEKKQYVYNDQLGLVKL